MLPLLIFGGAILAWLVLSLLGVSDSAGFIEINAAWKERLEEHHPDNGGDEQLAKMINRARDLLLEELEASKRR